MADGQNLDSLIRERLRGLLRKSSKSRAQTAEALSQLLPEGQHVSEHILSNWANGSKTGYSLPARAVPALCLVLGDDSLQRLLLSPELTAALELGEWDLKHLRREGRPPVRKASGAQRRIIGKGGEHARGVADHTKQPATDRRTT